MDDFKIEVFFAENIEIFCGRVTGLFGLPDIQEMRNLCAQGPGERDKPLGIFTQDLFIYAGTIIKTFEITDADKFDKIPVARHVLAQENQWVRRSRQPV